MTVRELREFLALLLTLCTPLISAAQQPASVSGYISDHQTGETLIAANLSIKDSFKGTSTNTSGYFMLTGLSAGSCTVVATYIGYEPYEKEITLAAGENLRLNINLKPKGYRLEEVVITSPRPQRHYRNIGTAFIETEFINDVPSVFEADIFRSLQLLPGIKASSDFSSGLYIRGGSPDQTLILLDQATIYNPTHFFGFYSTFNPDAVKDVQLYKGGFPAKYGGRLGSVVKIYNKDGNRNEFSGSATLGLLASRASIEGPFKNGSYILAVRRSSIEPLLALLQQSYDNIPSSFYFLDINSKINIDANPNNKFSVAFYTGKDHLVYPFADEAGINLDYGNSALSLNWTHLFSENLFSHFTFSGSQYFNYPSFDIASTPFERSNNIYDYSLKSHFEYRTPSNHTISVGLTAGSLNLELIDSFDGEQNFLSQTNSYYGSFYLQDEWKLSNKWMAAPGIRISAFSEGHYVQPEPRFSLEYRPSERFRLQAAYGRYYQFLTLVSNEAFSGFDVWLTSNESITPSSGNQYIAGLKTIPWQNHKFDVEVYYRSMENIFEPDPFIPNQSGLAYPETFHIGKGFAYGAEVYFERRADRLSGFIGYTFGISRRKFPEHNKGELSYRRQFFPPKHDRTHDLSIVMNIKLSSTWTTNLVFNFATGQPYTKPLGRTAAFDFPTRSNRLDQILVGQINASRLPPYHRLDIGFSRKGTFLGMGTSEWQFQLVNAYSRRNVWFYDYDLTVNPAVRKTVELLPILPSISYTLDF